MISIIKVKDISKKFRIGLKDKRNDTLISRIYNVIKYPYYNLIRLRNMNNFNSYDESIFWALKEINFEIKEGEVIGIIGRNGSGKSTLLKILSQITEPTSGRVEIFGRVASLLEVGTGFHPELSGRENIYMNGTILGMTRREIDSKLDEIIDFSGVEKFIDTPVKFYSSGMKVRLGFSIAAHLDPEILIIDEVLAVGDYEFQSKCLGKMKEVASLGRTVLFVSHNLEAVKSLCSRTILLESGRISFDGPTIDVIKYYLKDSSLPSPIKIWEGNDRPGNSVVRINSIIANSINFSRLGYFDRMDEIEISVNFELLKDNIPTNLSMILLTNTSEIVFNCHSQIPVPNLNSGTYSACCKIPSGLLNDDFYKISMLFVKDASTIIFSLEEILGFEIVDTEPRIFGWYGKFPGVIRPKLDFVLNV